MTYLVPDLNGLAEIASYAGLSITGFNVIALGILLVLVFAVLLIQHRTGLAAGVMLATVFLYSLRTFIGDIFSSLYVWILIAVGGLLALAFIYFARK